MSDQYIIKRLQEWLAIARNPKACHLTILSGHRPNTWIVEITPREKGDTTHG